MSTDEQIELSIMTARGLETASQPPAAATIMDIVARAMRPAALAAWFRRDDLREVEFTTVNEEGWVYRLTIQHPDNGGPA